MTEYSICHTGFFFAQEITYAGRRIIPAGMKFRYHFSAFSVLLMRTPFKKGITGLAVVLAVSRMPSKVVVSMSFRRFV